MGVERGPVDFSDWFLRMGVMPLHVPVERGQTPLCYANALSGCDERKTCCCQVCLLGLVPLVFAFAPVRFFAICIETWGGVTFQHQTQVSLQQYGSRESCNEHCSNMHCSITVV